MEPRRAVLAVLLTVLVLVPAAPAATPPLLSLPAAPEQGVAELELREQWRAGGEDDEEVFFGNVLQVLPAPDGGLYVLDSQQLRVFAFDAAGALRRTLGGRGEGPGEVTNVNSIVNLPDGGLGIGQVLPGVVACVRPDGVPERRIAIRDREDSGSSLVLFMDGWALGDGLLAIVLQWHLADGGAMAQDMDLRSYDLAGTPRVDFLHKRTAFDLADFRFTETGYDFVWTRCGVLPDGQVFLAPERNAYRIEIRSADGALVRSLARPYASLRRTAAEREEARLSHAAIASHYGREVRGVEVEDTAPDLVAVAARSDGLLWVRTSRGDRERPPGVLTTVDEIDPAGRFVRQVRLLAAGDPARDAIHLLDDGRVVVVRGAVGAYRREQNTERAQDTAALDVAPEVVCYGIGGVQ